MNNLTRLPDWQPRLAKLVNERRSVPYAYGSNDCWCFAQAAINAVTGKTLRPDIAPKTWLAAAKVLISNGWESVEAMMTELLGPPMDDPKTSQPGDIVSFELLGSEHLAVRAGDTALTPGRDRLEMIAVTEWRKAWRVG